MNKLRGKIKEVCGSESRFAELMGMSKGSISLKLNGKFEWSMKQIIKACGILGIDLTEINIYFFPKEVEQN